MDIYLCLRHHCIATDIKKRYNKAISNYLKRNGETSLQEIEIELLKNAFEHLDFAGLRARSPELSGHHNVDVILSGSGGGVLSLTVGGAPQNLIYITSKNTHT